MCDTLSDTVGRCRQVIYIRLFFVLKVNTRYTVNFTPVLEVNDDVLTWTNRHDTPDDVGRCTSYVSFGGIVAWSNENISQAFSNGGYVFFFLCLFSPVVIY